MNALRYLAEIASRTDDKASLKRYLSIIIAKEERESSPDVIRDYKKLLKVYSAVLPTTPPQPQEENRTEVLSLLHKILSLPSLSEENRTGALLKYSEYLVLSPIPLHPRTPCRSPLPRMCRWASNSSPSRSPKIPTDFSPPLPSSSDLPPFFSPPPTPCVSLDRPK